MVANAVVTLIVVFFVIVIVRVVSSVKKDKKLESKINACVSENKASLIKENITLVDECNGLIDNIRSAFPEYSNCIEVLDWNKTCNCKSDVVQEVQNSRQSCIKYIFKYSNLDYDIDSLDILDTILSYLSSMILLEEKLDTLLQALKSSSCLSSFSSDYIKLRHVWSLFDIDRKTVDMLEIPYIRFLYTSPAGNVQRDSLVVIDRDLAKMLQSKIEKKLTDKGFQKQQRSSMTNDLREAIKKRDNYTCCMCGNSVLKEPNLLLEVDHIIPVSKGGKTEASNLQTLCWRCNRSKSNKVD